MNETSANPLIQKLRIPGETFRLPSMGLFYTEELDKSVKDGEVHIYPMTAIDEIILKTPDKLFSGEAINEVFLHCMPGIKSPMELFAKDVDFLLVCLRLISYGPTIDLNWTHTCEKAKEHTYAVELKPFINNAKSIDPTTINNDYVVTVDSGQVVSLRPPRIKDVIKLFQTVDADFTADTEKLKKVLIDNLVSMIHDVDGEKNSVFIAEWLRTVPVSWISKITDGVEKISNWGPDFKVKTKCKDCGSEIELSAPINPISFFI